MRRKFKPLTALTHILLATAPVCTTAFAPLISRSIYSSPITNLNTKNTQTQHVINANNKFIASSTNFKSARSSSLSLRRKLLSEDDMAKPPNQKVIDTIEQISSSTSTSTTRIIASDVAAQTGLSLSETKQSLSALASLTKGDISVTSEGELVYIFPLEKNSLSSILQSNSLRYKLTNLWKKTVWPKLFWAIRVSFGLFLVVSIAAIFSTLLFIQSGGGSNSDDDRRDDRRGGGGGGGFGFRYGFGDVLFDLFYPRPYLYSTNSYGYYGSYNPYYNVMDSSESNDSDDYDNKKGIFEGIFSYIFGDGDPNRFLENARLREASRIIRANGGAVTAEQLAPFCDVDDPDTIMNEDFTLSDEGFVLPIVSQLGGVPTVTDDGDIIYSFPDLQVSTMEDDNGYASDYDMAYLQEMKIEFNRNEGFGNIAAGVLGAINLVGALYLGQVLSSPAMTGVQLGGFFSLVQTGYPLLVIYAILFNAIPALRYFYNQKVNGEIAQRNSARRKWLTYLQVGGTKIARKLQAAKTFQQRMKRLSGDDSVFDTRTKIEDLRSEKEAQDMKKFDELLRKKDNNDSEAFQ